MKKYMARFEVTSSLHGGCPLLDIGGKFNPLRFTWWDEEADPKNATEPILFEVEEISNGAVRIKCGPRTHVLTPNVTVSVPGSLRIELTLDGLSQPEYQKPDEEFRITFLGVEEISF